MNETGELVAKKTEMPTIHMVKDDDKFVCGRRKGEFTSDASLVTCGRCKQVITVTLLAGSAGILSKDQVPKNAESDDLPVVDLPPTVESVPEGIIVTASTMEAALQIANSVIDELVAQAPEAEAVKSVTAQLKRAKKEGVNGLTTRSNLHQMKNPKVAKAVLPPTPAVLARAQELASKKPGSVGSPCLCGCKGMTKGGRYLPGHDARHHSQLKEAAKKELERLAAKKVKG